jgi:multidrug efflux pump subunit AcrB
VTPVEEEYDGSLALLYEGAILAVLVVWLFLRDWRATFVSAVALPMSVIPAFIGMYLLGFSINVVTLLALSLVIGILVDDAIVEVENIVRHLRMGKTPYQAAMEAADEIGLAVIATTFTLIAVFLPTAFMSGVAGKFFKQFGWTASLAVFASLVVARVLTPMMAAYMLKPVGGHKDPGWMRDLPAVRQLVHEAPGDDHGDVHPVLLRLDRADPAAAHRLHPAGRQLADPGLYRAAARIDAGADAGVGRAGAADDRQSRARAQRVHHDRRRQRGRRSVRQHGRGRSAQGDAHHPAVRPQRPAAQAGIENKIRAALEPLPGVRSKVGLGGSGEKYMLVLTGEDPQALQAAALAVEKDLRTIPGSGQRGLHRQPDPPEIAVRPDFARAADLGVTSAAIGETLRIATAGDYDIALPKLNLSQRQVPIVVRLQDDARKDLSVLERLAVPGTHGAGDAGPGRDAGADRRPGRDRPLRPLAQCQLRDRTVRPAAGRRGGGRAAAAQR